MRGIDSALWCLVNIARHFSIPADYMQLERAYITDENPADTVTLLIGAKDLGLKARRLDDITTEVFMKLPQPSVAKMKDGAYLFVLGVTPDGDIIARDYRRANEDIRIVKAEFEKFFAGEAVIFTKRFHVEKLTDKVTGFGFRWFIPVVLKYKAFLFKVLGLSLILQFLGLLSPLFMQMIIDKVLVHHSLTTMDILMGGMIIVTIFNMWMSALRSYLFLNTTNKIDVILSSHLFKKVSELPSKFFDKWQVGDIVARMNEVESIRGFLTGSALTVVLDVVFAVVYVAVMFVYSSMLSYIVWATIPLYVLLNAVVAPIFKYKLNERFLLSSEQQSFTIETITGIRTVKTMGMESTFVNRYEEILSRFLKSSLGVLHVTNVAGVMGAFLQQTFNLALLWIGAYNVMAGALTVGELIAFQMLAGQVIAPILRLVNMWQSFQSVRVSMARLADIMDEKSEAAFNPNRTTLPTLRGEVVIDNVNFRYKADGKNVLSDVKLKIPAGAKVGIVGHSGCGKSTLTKLLQHLYAPDSGRILIDGVDIAQVETAWLRRQIGIVLQENFLFAGTIKDNIKIAMPSIDDESVMRAAELSGAADFVKEMPHGYDTFVGERGSLLSGGQRQRVAIARALLLDPRLLILDEATSALDTESEEHILKNLDKITAGRTTIIIAHRLSTVKDADFLVVMDKGKIMEIGTHQELMAKRGAYYHLYASQE